ncbi:TonB-dependent receptor [Brucella intermedia]|uniref:TonB-dependent receptor n=1 Tax=Brucella intermedia TaxID=94625 RepID=UPI00124E26DA|nr:TonB-dependent receptor [Brucella intermedia]KAB2716245.1 TonB-dependent receptor [Brucella intermedia]
MRTISLASYNLSHLVRRNRSLLLAGCVLAVANAAMPDASAEDRLRGKVLDNSAVAKAPIAPNTEAESPGEEGDIPFSISVDGETLADSGKPKPASGKADRQRRTDVGLAAVDIQVKFDGLDARPILNVSTNPVRRAYRAGEPVRFLATANYPAFISRSEIRVFETDKTLKEEPAAIIPVAINGEAEWTMPETENEKTRFKYILRVYGKDGRFDETLPRPIARTDKELPKESTKLTEAPAPGMGEDNTGTRNIDVVGGAVTVYGRNVPEGYQVKALDGIVPLDKNQAFVVQRILPPGEQDVNVAVLGQEKGSALDFSRQINIPDNDWFYVGLADLTVGKRMGDDGIEDVRPGEYDEVYTKGRLAFYVKGKIKGKYLLTAAADSREGDIKDMFRGLDDRDPRSLLRRIDPDAYYPVYGDDSTIREDAPTNGKFYVRLDRGPSHVMWGNYKASIKGTEFMRSERGLYGANAVYNSEEVTSFGERKTEVNVYAAQPDTLPQRDEFLGTGGSAYFLKRQDITTGSETLTVEVRDQVTGEVKERRTLIYGEDYTLDYLQGVVILKRPLSSSTGTGGAIREGALGGNRIYLIAQYEFTPAIGEVDGYVYGGRAQHWFDEKVRVGVTGMNETTGEANQQAVGADIVIRHSEKTFLEAEVSHSKGPGFGLSRSTDGGLTLSDVATTGTRDRAAMAWRTRGQFDLEDIVKGGVKGTVGAYYGEKQAGFSTLAEQVTVDERIWGVNANLDLTKDTALKLTYDDYVEGREYDEFYQRETGGRTKRKGEATVSHQLDEYWKASFGVSYTELRSPIAVYSGKRGYDGERLDAGVRLDYAPDADHKYYVFGQGTLSRDGDVRRNDRLGVGTKYQLTEKVGLEGEISYGNSGLGGLAAITYSPTASDNYYFGYRLDPDRAFDLDRSYDLDGVDKGTFVLGMRRKLDDTLSTYAENNYDLFGRRMSLTKTYGVIYTPDKVWTVDGGFEAGSVEDDTVDPDTGAERSNFDRKAVSLSVGYKDEEQGINARIRGEARFEDSDDGSRDRNTYLFATGLSWKTSEDWRLLVNVDAVLSDSSEDGSFRDGNYVDASIGYAYRPVDNDRLNALFKYAWVYDLPGENQVSAITGDEYGPAQRSHIVSADFTYDLMPWLSVGGKYGMRYGQVRERQMEDDRKEFSDWYTSSAHLGIVRADLHIVKNWDALVEGRVLHMPEAKTTDYGALLAVYRHVGENFKVGAGYNFGAFSDDLRDLTLNDRGVFLNVIGKF